MKRELIESVQMMIGFMPWILFLFIGGNSLAGLSTFKFTHRDPLPERVYANISIGIMISGVAFTAIYRHIKKKQRTQKEGIEEPAVRKQTGT